METRNIVSLLNDIDIESSKFDVINDQINTEYD